MSSSGAFYAVDLAPDLEQGGMLVACCPLQLASVGTAAVCRAAGCENIM